MDFLIPFGVEFLVALLKKASESKKVKKWYHNCITKTESMEIIEEMGSNQEYLEHPVYIKAMHEWDDVVTLHQAIKWHDTYTPQLQTKDYIYYYYPLENIPIKQSKQSKQSKIFDHQDVIAEKIFHKTGLPK